jgi:sortase A
MRKWPALLILAGLLMVLWPSANHWIEDYNQHKLLDTWNMENVNNAAIFNQFESVEVTMSNLTHLFSQEQPYADSASDGNPTADIGPSTSVAAESVPNPAPTATPIRVSKAVKNQPKIVGILEIPDIDLKLPVLEGISSANLNIAAGHIPGTDVPGQLGNCVIAAHRSYTYGRMFNRLEQLNVGNEIHIRTTDTTFTFTVYEIKTVEPTDVSVLNRNKQQRILTLLTCTEDGSQRLVLHAVLKSHKKA